MTEQQITLAKALDLVSFQLIAGKWQVKDVKGNVFGFVFGDVFKSVYGNVHGHVVGTSNGKHWDYLETPQEDN